LPPSGFDRADRGLLVEATATEEAGASLATGTKWRSASAGASAQAEALAAISRPAYAKPKLRFGEGRRTGAKRPKQGRRGAVKWRKRKDRRQMRRVFAVVDRLRAANSRRRMDCGPDVDRSAVALSRPAFSLAHARAHTSRWLPAAAMPCAENHSGPRRNTIACIANRASPKNMNNLPLHPMFIGLLSISVSKRGRDYGRMFPRIR
jgi:hypothetical protein